MDCDSGDISGHDQVYFKSYEDLDIHRLMLDDAPRTLAYKTAIEANRELFGGKTVLDIGAGTGILSLFAASIGGASKVYACEASNLALLLPSIFAKNGFNSDKIQVLHDKVENLSIDKDFGGQRIDIIVSEWMGFYLLHESMIESVIWARDNLLDSANGKIFPEKCEIWGCPVNVPELWKNHSSKDYWEVPKYGFDFSSIGENVEFSTSTPKIDVISGDNLLADPQSLWKIDLYTIRSEHLVSHTDRRFMPLTDDGDLHGVAIWWTCTFPNNEKSESEPIELSTAPWDPPTHWKQLVVLLPQSTSVDVDEILGWNLTLTKDKDSTESEQSRSYKISLELLWGEQDHPVPCDCGTVTCEIIKAYISENPTTANTECQAQQVEMKD